MSITRVGSTQKFSDGWAGIFGGDKKKAAGKKASGKKAAAGKKAGKDKAKKKKTAKNTAPVPTGRIESKKRVKPRKPDGQTDGPGDAKAKKSAAKRTSKTRKKRAQPVLQQMELF